METQFQPLVSLSLWQHRSSCMQCRRLITVAEAVWKAEKVAVVAKKLGTKQKATDWPMVAVK